MTRIPDVEYIDIHQVLQMPEATEPGRAPIACPTETTEQTGQDQADHAA